MLELAAARHLTSTAMGINIKEQEETRTIISTDLIREVISA